MNRNVIRRRVANISVIIPTVGRKIYLRRCLISLLSQSVLPSEIIIVNNGSSPLGKDLQLDKKKTTPIHIVYVREERQGVGYARNAGLRAASNNMIAFIDDDCVAQKNWIEHVLFSFSKNPKTIIKGKNTNGFRDNIFSALEYYQTELHFQSQLVPFLDTKNFALRKSDFLNSPYFDTRFARLDEDIDFGIRANLAGIFVIYDQSVVVAHFGRSTFIAHLKRGFYVGRDRWKLEDKWKRNQLVTLEKEELFSNIKKQNKEKTKERLLKEILKKKNLFFRLAFFSFPFIDLLTEKLGYMWEELHNTNIYEGSNST